MAKAIIPWVMPQGINTVNAPKIAGENKSPLFDTLLIFLVINLGGWMIKYLKNGWRFSKAPAVPIIKIATAICRIAWAESDSSNREPNQPSNKPRRVYAASLAITNAKIGNALPFLTAFSLRCSSSLCAIADAKSPPWTARQLSPPVKSPVVKIIQRLVFSIRELYHNLPKKDFYFFISMLMANKL